MIIPGREHVIAARSRPIPAGVPIHDGRAWMVHQGGCDQVRIVGYEIRGGLVDPYELNPPRTSWMDRPRADRLLGRLAQGLDIEVLC